MAELRTLRIRPNNLKMMLVAGSGLVLVGIALDIIWLRLLTDWLRARVFLGDTQIFEPRDAIWGWAMLVVGLVLVVWGAKQLLSPTVWLSTHREGLGMGILADLGHTLIIPWRRINKVTVEEIIENEEPNRMLVIDVSDARLLPIRVINARLISPTKIALFTHGWDTDPEQVVEIISEWKNASPKLRQDNIVPSP